MDDVAQVEDVLHEEGGFGDAAWALPLPNTYNAVVADVVVKQWKEADLHAGSRPLWCVENEEDDLRGDDGCADGGCRTQHRHSRAMW